VNAADALAGNCCQSDDQSLHIASQIGFSRRACGSRLAEI
jgi:hypothetical protein